jgi:hypothetical protein
VAAVGLAEEGGGRGQDAEADRGYVADREPHHWDGIVNASMSRWATQRLIRPRYEPRRPVSAPEPRRQIPRQPVDVR